MQRILKEYFKNLFNIATQEQVAVHMFGSDGVQRGSYFRGEQIRSEVEVRVGKLKNEKDEITKEMIKGGGDKVVDWTCRL